MGRGSAHSMARIRSDIPYGYDDTSRVGFWTPETPEFLEKRDERRAASYANITSYSQAKASIRRVSLANQEVSAAASRQRGDQGAIIDFDWISRDRDTGKHVQVRVDTGSANRGYRLSERPFANRPAYGGYANDGYANDFDGGYERDAYSTGRIADVERGASTRYRYANDASLMRESRTQRTRTRSSRNVESRRFGSAYEGGYDAGFDDEFQEDEQPRRASLAARLKKVRHDRRHRQADRAFARDYDAPAPADEGPRAAVYKGKMGRQHQRATRMQAQAPGFSLHMPAFLSGIIEALKLDRLVFRPWFAVTAVTVFCVVLVAGSVYPAAQDYYLQLRANDQLAAEYEAIVERNAELEDHVEALKTDEGMEELAHVSLGWVAEGENAVSVLTDGSAEPGTSTLSETEAVAEGSVPAPETWYSPVLDAFFGYKG